MENVENGKLTKEALDKLGVSGGAFDALTGKEKLAIAAMCAGSAAVGAGVGVLATNKYQTGNWLGKGKGSSPGAEDLYLPGPPEDYEGLPQDAPGHHKATEEELKNEKLKNLFRPKSFFEEMEQYESAVQKAGL